MRHATANKTWATTLRATSALALALGMTFGMTVGMTGAQAQSPEAKAATDAAAAANQAASAATSAAQSASAAAQSVQDLKSGFPADSDRLDGDKLTLRTRATGFVELEGNAEVSYCAPSESEAKVIREVGVYAFVRFLAVARNVKDPTPPDISDVDRVDGAKLAAAKRAAARLDVPRRECSDESRVVKKGIAYRIERTRLKENNDYRRTGFAFGALIVPFKFRFGDNEIVASPTVAPYVGWRTGFLGSYGLNFTPVFSAGLGLVPVTDPASSQTQTRPALSVATGVVLRSNKNDSFEAGVLLGRDFLGRADAALDPGSKKPWLSFYIGISQ